MALSPKTLLVLKGSLAVALGVSFSMFCFLSVRDAGLEGMLRNMETALASEGIGEKPSEHGQMSREELTKERKALREELFNPETNQRIQALHDRLQRRYGDQIYRSKLKTRAAREALGAYLEDLGKGKLNTPAGWTRELTPEDVARMVDQAEVDYAGAPGTPPGE